MNMAEFQDLLHRCFRCGYCKFTADFAQYNCPPYRRFRLESFSPGGRMWLIRAVQAGELPPGQGFAKILYTCTMCGNCVEECRFKFHDDLMKIITAARTDLVERSIVPPAVRDFFKNIYTSGNPWKASQEERGRWAEEAGIPLFDGSQDYLLYVGCIGSYDRRARKIVLALAELFSEGDLSFGILGEQESCDGNEVFRMGEDGLFQYLAERNIASFRSKGVKKIVTLSPHAFNIMTHEYPKLGGAFDIVHYTELLSKFINDGKLAERSPAPPLRVTYHDPCFLGRWNRRYDDPRSILHGLPGVLLVEMEANRENARCCGGGGGNFYTDFLGSGEDSPARLRIREAAATGADRLVLACPTCMTMFADAVKVEGLEERLAVLDIAELLLERRKETGEKR